MTAREWRITSPPTSGLPLGLAVAFLDDWRSSQFHRALAEEHFDREAMMAGEWHE